MNKYKHILLLLFIPVFAVAQQATNYSRIDKRMMQIPQSMTTNVDKIANYVKANFKTDEEKTRAVFYWITQNISYDVTKMNSAGLYNGEKQIIDEVMQKRKGVCQHYATLFSWICNRAGVKTFIVSGYTQQYGKLAKLPHAWDVAYVNSKWELFDPTWGSGNIQGNEFVKELNNFYFNTEPKEFIKTHCPFDPMWQLLNYPISNTKFISGETDIDKTEPFFNYADSIDAYSKLSRKEQLLTSCRRLKNKGLDNSMLTGQYKELQDMIGRYRQEEMINIYNLAIAKYNTTVSRMNDFIEYRNRKFTPIKPDADIKLMLVNVETPLNECKKLLQELTLPDPTIKESKQQLTKSVESLDKELTKQKAFLKKYFSTKKIFRKSLFYRISWMGIKLN